MIRGQVRRRSATFLIALLIPWSAAAQTDSSEVRSALKPPPAEFAATVKDLQDRVLPDRHVRVTGSFGSFEGYVAHVTEGGLAGLTRSDTAPSSSNSPPPDPLAWTAISKLEMRESQAAQGAAIGAAVVGVPSALFAARVASDQTTGDQIAASLVTLVIMGGLGAIVGLPIGASIHHWVTLYSAPPPK